MPPDNRLHAFRADLADERLRGRVEARRFVSPIRMQVTHPLVNVHIRPDTTAMQVSQALMGEVTLVYEVQGTWAWVQLADDGYVGYVLHDALTNNVVEPTHRVSVVATVLYPQADLKSQPVRHLSLNCKVAVAGVNGDFLALQTGGFIFAAHATPLESARPDFVDAAEMFLNTPYLWGGKGHAGLDCSGLVQVAMQAGGHAAQRDADMQEKTVGSFLRINDLDGLRRGDLVFWDGHVGMMTDQTTLLHANGHHMMVVKEPLADAIARIGAAGKPVTAVKRI
jgi:cell wall-associated NlpC family hydrolase